MRDTIAARRRAGLEGLPALTRVLDRLGAWDEAVRSRWPFSALVGPDIQPGAVTDDGSRLLLRPAILGFVAIVAITAGVSQQRSPFVLKQAGAWFFGVPATGVTPSSHDLFFGLVAVYGGLVLLMRSWYGIIRTTSQLPEIPVRKLMMIGGLWVVPLLIAPPLFSRDVYSYVAQGEMMSHHISPYQYGPSVLGAGAPALSFVDPLWKNTPAPYGPLFMWLDGALTSLSLHHELINVVLLRLMAVAGVALIAVCLPELARSMGRSPSYVFALAVLNPVTILHLVGGAHNDALMLGLLVAGITVARRGRPAIGILLCSLAAAVKVPAAIGIIYIGWEWMGAGIPRRSRVRPLVTAGLISVGVMGGLSIVTGLGWSWVLNLATPGTVRSWVAPATGAGILFTQIAHLVGIGVPLHTMLSITRLAGLATACGVGIWVLLRSDKVGALWAMGVTLLLVVALGPVVQPWYLSWGLILLAPVATGRIRSLIVGVSIASAFIGLPGGRQLVGELVSANPLTVAVALLACLAILTVPLTPMDREQLLPRWYRRRRGSDSDSDSEQGTPPELDLATA